MAMSKAGCPIPTGSDVVPGIQIKGDELPHTVRWRDMMRVVMQSIRVVHRLPRGPWRIGTQRGDSDCLGFGKVVEPKQVEGPTAVREINKPNS